MSKKLRVIVTFSPARGRTLLPVTALAIFGCAGLPAQVVTSLPGATTIVGHYNPLQPAPKAPVTSGLPPVSIPPMLPTIPMEQYLAVKAASAQNTQSSFPFPVQVQVSGTVAPRAPGAAPKAPISPSATLSWQGIQIDHAKQALVPSPDIAVGPSDVVMVVNSTIAQFTRSGTLVKQTDFADWFATIFSTICPTGAAHCLIYDPSIRYDQMHGRFLFLATATTDTNAVSNLVLSVSNGATFDSGWTIWAMDAMLNGTTPTPYWGDFWRFSFDNVAVYLSGNMYQGANSFQYAKIRVLKKSDLYLPSSTRLTWKDLPNLLNEDLTKADSLCPVEQRGKPAGANGGLFISATTITRPASFLTLWKIDNPLAATLTVVPTTVRGVWSYDYPAAVQQVGSLIRLDSGDSRMLKAVSRSGYIYTARDTGYPDQSTTITYDVIDAATAKVASQSRLINTNAFYPAFDVPASVPAGTPFASTDAIFGTTTAADGNMAYASISKVHLGEGYFDNGKGAIDRWGDYFGGSVDPISGGLWTAGQYAKLPNTNGLGVWGTWAAYFPWSTTSTFADVPSTSPYADYVNILNLWQITGGCSATPAMFCPTQLVSRAQLATFIVRAVVGDNFTYTATPYFTDVQSNNIYFPYVQKMRDLQLTNGCSLTTFCPDDPVSRADAAVFLMRGKFTQLFGDGFTYPTTPYFTDVPTTLATFPFVQKMYELGITAGCSATTYCPNSLLTRQEISVFITRAFLN